VIGAENTKFCKAPHGKSRLAPLRHVRVNTELTEGDPEGKAAGRA
jgi:hypothetical protein